jgi:hypothetical protein
MSVNEKANLPLGFLHPHRRVSLLLDLRSIPVGSVPSAILLLFSPLLLADLLFCITRLFLLAGLMMFAFYAG